MDRDFANHTAANWAQVTSFQAADAWICSSRLFGIGVVAAVHELVRHLIMH